MKLRITVEGKSYEVDVEVLDEPQAPVAFRAAGLQGVDGTGVRIPKSVLASRPRDEMPGDKICRSPIAGLISSVLASVGQQVEENEPLFVIEAMKMETKITASKAGVVKTILVSQGETVKTGQVLLELS